MIPNTPQIVSSAWSRITGKSKVPRIPSLALGKRGTCQVHELGPYFKKKYTKKKRKERIPVYPIQYLHNKVTTRYLVQDLLCACRNHGPGLRKEKRKTMY